MIALIKQLCLSREGLLIYGVSILGGMLIPAMSDMLKAFSLFILVFLVFVGGYIFNKNLDWIRCFPIPRWKLLVVRVLTHLSFSVTAITSFTIGWWVSGTAKNRELFSNYGIQDGVERLSPADHNSIGIILCAFLILHFFVVGKGIKKNRYSNWGDRSHICFIPLLRYHYFGQWIICISFLSVSAWGDGNFRLYNIESSRCF